MSEEINTSTSKGLKILVCGHNTSLVAEMAKSLATTLGSFDLACRCATPYSEPRVVPTAWTDGTGMDAFIRAVLNLRLDIGCTSTDRDSGKTIFYIQVLDNYLETYRDLKLPDYRCMQKADMLQFLSRAGVDIPGFDWIFHYGNPGSDNAFEDYIAETGTKVFCYDPEAESFNKAKSRFITQLLNELSHESKSN